MKRLGTLSRLPAALHWMLLAAVTPASALECPAMPQQTQRDWDVAVAVAVGRLGAVSGPQLQAQTRSVTTDLLKRLPNADRVYLEQMMYATYCSALRDNSALNDAQRDARIAAYNRELRATLTGTAKPAASAADPRDAARAALARLPVAYDADAFVASAAAGRTDVVRLFVQAGIDPNAAGREGRTALMAAAERGDLQLVDLLLKSRADVNARLAPRGELSALAFAAGHGQLPAVQALLRAGADRASLDPALWNAIHGGHVDIARALAAAGADVAAGKQQWPALLAATPAERFGDMLSFLRQRGWDVDTRAEDGETALMFAAYENRLPQVRLLLAASAQVNLHCDCSGFFSGGHSALTAAAASTSVGSGGDGSIGTSVALMTALLDAGAAVDHPARDGTALMFAVHNSRPEVVALLLSRGAKPDAARRADGATALMYATYTAANRELVPLLLSHGADVNASAPAGGTALMWAADRNQAQIAQLLLDAGARLEASTRRGRTALTIGVMSGSFETVRLLLRAGARTDVLDEDGRTLQDLADSELDTTQRARMRALLSRTEKP